jgi:hypothetical protein
MKKLFLSFSMLAILFTALISCDNGNADIKLFDSPPSITLTKPLNYTSNVAFDLKATFKDGADPSLSKSPLTSASYSIKSFDFATTREEGALTVSGVVTTITKPVAALAAGRYKLILTAVDKNNNTKKDTTTFEVLTSAAIIGSATPNGWGTETPMTRSTTDPDVYTITLTFAAGEAKFRANNAWTLAWGDTKFPSGTGSTAGGAPNIPVPAGRFLVTLNISSGAYSFVAAP